MRIVQESVLTFTAVSSLRTMLCPFCLSSERFGLGCFLLELPALPNLNIPNTPPDCG